MSKLDEARAAVERLRKRFSIRSDGVPLDLDLIAAGLDEAERRAKVAEVKQYILDVFSVGDTGTYSAVCEGTGADLEIAVLACAELQTAGYLEGL